jgi:hypothetical protein
MWNRPLQTHRPKPESLDAMPPGLVSPCRSTPGGVRQGSGLGSARCQPAGVRLARWRRPGAPCHRRLPHKPECWCPARRAFLTAIQVITYPLAGTRGGLPAQPRNEGFFGAAAPKVVSPGPRNGGNRFAARQDSNRFPLGDCAQQAGKLAIGVCRGDGFHMETPENVVLNTTLFLRWHIVKNRGRNRGQSNSRAVQLWDLETGESNGISGAYFFIGKCGAVSRRPDIDQLSLRLARRPMTEGRNRAASPSP